METFFLQSESCTFANMLAAVLRYFFYFDDEPSSILVCAALFQLVLPLS